MARAAPSDVGQWGPLITFPGVAIHAVLLHTGEVLMFEKVTGQPGSNAWLWNPATGAITDRSMSRIRDLWCSGHSVLPNGDVLITGGHPPGGSLGVGVYETDIYRADTGTWQPGPPMSQPRWYPTNIELSDGTTLILTGQKVKGVLVPEIDSYHPATGTLTTLPTTANRKMPMYPRMHLMPNGKLFVAGPAKSTNYFDPTTNRWSFVANMNAAARYAGTSVLLPGLQRVMAFGGMGSGGASRDAEIIDLSNVAPLWQLIQPMNHPRQHLNGVLLPDGTVLAVGGGLSGQYAGPQLIPELYDPAAGTWTDMASQQAGRMYHATALLLPDGRVLSAGQTFGPLQKTGEIYSPPYLFRGPRPTISSAPSQVGFGRPMAVEAVDASQVSKMVLMRPASVTHSVDFEQRSIDLPFSTSGNTLSTTSPLNGNIAPPGWYMLFLLSPLGVPSIASWVHVG